MVDDNKAADRVTFIQKGYTAAQKGKEPPSEDLRLIDSLEISMNKRNISTVSEAFFSCVLF
jgi:hypothetical protein